MAFSMNRAVFCSFATLSILATHPYASNQENVATRLPQYASTETLQVSASNVYEPRPDAFGRWSVPFDHDGQHGIVGDAFDFKNRKPYPKQDRS